MFFWKKKYNNKRAFEKIKRTVPSLYIEEGGFFFNDQYRRKRKNKQKTNNKNSSWQNGQ